PLTWTVKDAPVAMVPKLPVRTWWPLTMLMDVKGLSSLQVTPSGRVSVRVTFWAAPAPSLLTTSVKVAVSPALIVPVWLPVLPPVLTGWTSGQLVMFTGIGGMKSFISDWKEVDERLLT